MRMQVRSLAALRGLRIWHCREQQYSHRHDSDPALLWLWCSLAAVAPIRPLDWELPYAAHATLKSKKKNKERKKEKRKKEKCGVFWWCSCFRISCCYCVVQSLAQEFPHTSGTAPLKMLIFKVTSNWRF